MKKSALSLARSSLFVLLTVSAVHPAFAVPLPEFDPNELTPSPEGAPEVLPEILPDPVPVDSVESAGSHWDEVGLRFSVLEEVVTNAGCHSDKDFFVACIAATNRILGSDSEPVAIVPEAAFQNLLFAFRYAKTDAKGEGFRISHKPTTPHSNDPIQNIREERKEREMLLRHWEAFYSEVRSGSRNGISFENILKVAKQRVVTTASREHHLTAYALNDFLNAAFDPHTYIVPTAQLEEQRNSSSSFVGIGIESHVAGNQLIVRTPIEGGPAHKAGIRARDVIIAVNGKKVAEIGVNAAIRSIGGAEGSKVTLEILRNGQSLKITATRAKIEQKNVVSKALQNKIGYLKLASFVPQDSCAALGKSFAALRAGGSTRGMVLDLRGNGGGEVGQGVCTTSLFAPERDQLVVEFRPTSPSQQPVKMKTIPAPNAAAVPLVVLVDSASASASELVAGALQDIAQTKDKPILIVGEATFGKGTAQSIASAKVWKPIAAYDSVLSFALTVFTFHLPSGRSNQIVGIQPDITAYSNPNPTEADQFAMREKDLYLNPILPTGPTYRQKRPDYVRKIQDCRKARGNRADAKFKQRQADAIAPDYPLLVAEDVLDCMTKR